MSRICKISGKRPLVGNNVSHANNKTKRRQFPNLQSKQIYIEELGKSVRVRLSARALKSVSRVGLMPFLRKQGLSLSDVVS
jgi:large subunit ribosomal protein L28